MKEPVKKEMRLVAVIYPTGSWGIQGNPDEWPRIAKRGEDHEICLCHVGPMQHDECKRMVYRSVNVNGEIYNENWQQFLEELQNIPRNILYLDDFQTDDPNLYFL